MKKKSLLKIIIAFVFLLPLHLACNENSLPQETKISSENPQENPLVFQANEAEKDQNLQQAASIFEQLLSKYPDNPYFMYRLGRIYSILKKWDEAEKYLTRSLEINPDDQDTRLALARMYYWKKEYKKAEKELLIILQKMPNYTEASILLGKVYYAEEKNEVAEIYLKQGLNDSSEKTSYFSFKT
ncbi:MAG: tetratricopeptide repeat protein [Chlamydiae bacterium]|nr:tetratricopeptide repeat protein [Chlamydiota bacterium]